MNARWRSQPPIGVGQGLSGRRLRKSSKDETSIMKRIIPNEGLTAGVWWVLKVSESHLSPYIVSIFVVSSES